jgi:hypothetical protein
MRADDDASLPQIPMKMTTLTTMMQMATALALVPL